MGLVLQMVLPKFIEPRYIINIRYLA